ncbi:MAG: hypothetical protein AAGJ81_14610 [Verrucomicrobiota bacterium]
MIGNSGSSGYQDLFSGAGRGSTAIKSDIRDLQQRLDKLEIVSEAMWLLLKEKTGLSDEDLIYKVSEVDLEDGKLDGKKKKPSARECHKCGRKNHRNHTRCLYCGELLLSHPF